MIRFRPPFFVTIYGPYNMLGSTQLPDLNEKVVYRVKRESLVRLTV